MIAHGHGAVYCLFRIVFAEWSEHGTYIRWYLTKRCARKEKSLLFDLYKAFDQFESRHKWGIFSERTCFPSFVRNI